MAGFLLPCLCVLGSSTFFKPRTVYALICKPLRHQNNHLNLFTIRIVQKTRATGKPNKEVKNA
nr:MAG TPA: hypothetical protein [Caudoviricetes sp.]